MSTAPGLDFQPIPLRTGRWRAELTGIRYVICQSKSGFVVNCKRSLPGSAENASVPDTPTDFFATLEAAVAASNGHYRRLMH
ncbi:MAG TPA: hypothetical protein VHX44_11905 [Planctomycetota bacterium]|nr:hypothetical protein [Planctomycetota bacterium]